MPSEAKRKALKKYKASVKRFTIDFTPRETDLWEYVQEQKNKQGFIKNLIRVHMNGTQQ